MKVKKQPIAEVKKYDHATKRTSGQYGIFMNVPPDMIEEVSKALTSIMLYTGMKKAGAMRQAILCFEPGIDAIKCIALALEIIHSLPRDTPGLDDISKALTGCRADVSSVSVIEFTDESDEYKKFWDDGADAQP